MQITLTRGDPGTRLDHVLHAHLPQYSRARLQQWIRNGQALSDSATDATVNGASSGVSSVAYNYCSVASCTPATLIGSGSTGPNFSFTWNSQPIDGSTYRVQKYVPEEKAR